MSRKELFKRSTIALCTLILASALSLSTIEAQQEVSSWTPWIGCWTRIGDEDVQSILCMLPSDEYQAVEAMWIGSEGVLRRETIRADAQRYSASLDECRGWAEGQFSENERRVYLKSEYTCVNDDSIAHWHALALHSQGSMLSVQAVKTGDSLVTGIDRYWRIQNEVLDTIGLGELVRRFVEPNPYLTRLAGTELEASDLIELAFVMPSQIAVLLTIELGVTAAMRADDIFQLRSAGVPDNLIDVVVARSYPEWFAVQVASMESLGEKEDPDNQRPFSIPLVGLSGLPGVDGYSFTPAVVAVSFATVKRGSWPDKRRGTRYVEMCSGFQACEHYIRADEIWDDYSVDYHDTSSFSDYGESSSDRTAKPRGGSN